MVGVCVKVRGRRSISTRDKHAKSNVKIMTAYLIAEEYCDNASVTMKIRVFPGTSVYQMLDYILFYT